MRMTQKEGYSDGSMLYDGGGPVSWPKGLLPGAVLPLLEPVLVLPVPEVPPVPDVPPVPEVVPVPDDEPVPDVPPVPDDVPDDVPDEVPDEVPDDVPVTGP